MKKFVGILFLVLCCTFFISAEEFDGTYTLKPYIIRLSDGRLIHPDKPYAYQYSGIVKINFLENSFARILTVEGTFDSFYEVRPGDSDNTIISFNLRNGSLFTLELAQEDKDRFRYYYTLTDPPFEPAPSPQEEIPSETVKTPEVMAGNTDQVEMVSEEISSETDMSSVELSVFIGIMVKEK